jgi:hypothetical protein
MAPPEDLDPTRHTLAHGYTEEQLAEVEKRSGLAPGTRTTGETAADQLRKLQKLRLDELARRIVHGPTPERLYLRNVRDGLTERGAREAPGCAPRRHAERRARCAPSSSR